jgi:hypothetical protein
MVWWTIGLALVASGFAMAAYTVYALYYSGRTVFEGRLDAVPALVLAPGARAARMQQVAQAIEVPVDASMRPLAVVATGLVHTLPVASLDIVRLRATVASLRRDGSEGERAVTDLQLSRSRGSKAGSEVSERLELPRDWSQAARVKVWIEPADAASARFRPAYTIAVRRNVLPFHKGWIAWIFAGPLLGFVCLAQSPVRAPLAD